MARTKKPGPATTTEAPAKATKATARKTVTKNTAAAKPESVAKTSPAKPAAAKSAPVKLTENQAKFLGTIHAAGASGYEPKNKNEQRSIDALVSRKLVKRGTKNKETGNFRFVLTKAGTGLLPAI